MTTTALKLRTVLAIAGAAVLFAVPAFAGDDIFLKLQDIQGDSTDEAHRGEIRVQSYSQSVQNSATFGTGGASAGKATCGDIVITKTIDKSSPGLIMKVLTGASIPTGTLSFRRAGSERRGPDYYTVQLTDIRVNAVEQSSATTSDVGVVELIRLKVRQFRLTYYSQLPDGSLGAPQTFAFDCASGGRF